MPVWGAFAGVLGLNVWRHRKGQSTWCSATREYVPDMVFCIAWGALTGWLIPHYVRGRYASRQP